MKRVEQNETTRLTSLSKEGLMRRMLDGGHLNPMAEAKIRKELGIEADPKLVDSSKILGTLQTNGLPITRQTV